MQHSAVRSLYLYINEQVMMESKRLECLLDSTKLFRARLQELHQQQHRLCLESIAIMVAQADLPVPSSSVKDRKGATPYFQTTRAEQRRDNYGKENIVPSDSVLRGAQLNSCKASGANGRKRRKPLVDSQAVNQSGQLHASSICTRVVDGGQLEEDVVFQQQREGNEKLVHSMEGNKSMSLPVRGNEELVHSVEENDKGMSKSMRPLRDSFAREAEDTVSNFGNPRTSRGAGSSGGKASQVKIEIGDTPILIDIDAPRLTRAQARLKGNVTKARGEPPLKKLRGRKGHLKSTSISPPTEKNEAAEKLQNISPSEQQTREGWPSERPPAVKRRNSKANSELHAVETHENVGNNGVIDEGQDMKVKLENVPPNVSCTAEEEAEENIGEGRPSKKSRTLLGNARLNSPAEAYACKLGQTEDSKAAVHLLPNLHSSAQDHDRRGGLSTKRSRELSANAALRDGKLGKFDTVVTNENESMHRTVTDQPRTKSYSSKDGAVLAEYSSPLHSDISPDNFTIKGGLVHSSMDERDRVDSAQADDIDMPLAHNDTASEVRISSNSAKMKQVKEADLDGVNSSRVDRGRVRGGTDLRLECLLRSAGLPKRRFSRVEPPLKDSTDAGAKPRSVVSSPPPLIQIVQREADITLLDHQELKGEGTSCIAEVPAKEYRVEEDPAPTKGRPRIRFSDSLAETDDNQDGTRRIVAHSVGVHSSAIEPESYETTMDAIVRADVQSSAMSQAAENTDETKNGMQLWSVGSSLRVSISPQDRDCNNVDQGGLAPGSEIKENGQQPQWVCNKLEPMDCSADEPMPFSIDESSASLQNKKTTDLLLELWKRGGLPNSCLTAEEVPWSSEPHDTVDVIDEVYRSVIVRDCGGNGAGSVSTLPVTDWSSGSVHDMTGVAPQSGARLMERGLHLDDEPEKLEPTEVDSLDDGESDQEKPSSLLIQEQMQMQEQDLDTQVRKLTEVGFFDDRKLDQEEEIIKLSSLLIQEHVQEQDLDTQVRELDSLDDGKSDQEQDPDTQDSVSAFANSGFAKCSQEMDTDCGVSSETEQLLSHEEHSMTKTMLLSRLEEEPDVSRREDSPDDDVAVPVVDPSCNPVGSVYSLPQVVSSNNGKEEEIMKPSSLLIQELVQEQDLETQVRELTEVDSLDDGEEEIRKLSSLPVEEHVQEQSLDTQVRELTEVDSLDGKSDQEQDPDIQDSAFANSEFAECSQEMDTDGGVSSETEQLLSHEEHNMNKPMLLSRVEEEPEVSRHEDRPEDDVAVPVVSPSCNPVGSVYSLPQVVSSNNGNAQLKSFSNLVASMKSFVPVSQQPAPSFLPDGKRVVKVKALITAEAARKAEENGDVKDWRLKRARRIEENASSGMEKDETVEARSRQLKESVDGSSRPDGGESSCGGQFSPKKKVLLRTRSNSRNLFSPDLKSKANLGNGNKVKKNQAELKRIEEERRRQLLATRQMKEDIARQMKEDLAKKHRERQEVLKQRKDQNRLLAEQEDKGQRHQAQEEAEREKKEMEEKIKHYTPRPREKENLQGEEFKLRGAGAGLLQAAGYARPGQTTPPKIRSNLLGPGSLPLRSAVRVPVISKDKRTPATMAKAVQAVQKKGRHPSSISSSSSKLLALNAEPSRLPSFNAQSSRLPSLNAEPARVSSMTAESAEGHRHNSATHTFSVDNIRPGYVGQVGTGDFLPCIQTPCSEAGEKEDEDEGPTSYEMSPYRESDDEGDEDQPEKIIPRWANKENLNRQLLKQLALDPDDIFAGSKTCSLKDVFGTTGSRKIQDFGKRSGSGDWFQDRVSWREELQYKINMGYMPRTYPS